jgi:hypothetical protein
LHSYGRMITLAVVRLPLTGNINSASPKTQTLMPRSCRYLKQDRGLQLSSESPPYECRPGTSKQCCIRRETTELPRREPSVSILQLQRRRATWTGCLDRRDMTVDQFPGPERWETLRTSFFSVAGGSKCDSAEGVID